MHYLIIEDDPAIKTILKDIFEMLKQDEMFTYLEDGHQAVAWIKKVEAGEIESLPDIAFIDIRMPGLHGYEIAEQMRKAPALSNIGIILMTAFELSEEEFDEAMRRSQADRFVSKPLPGFKGLVQMVDEIMELRKPPSEDKSVQDTPVQNTPAQDKPVQGKSTHTE